MSVDGIMIRAITIELIETINEGKITRIFQPETFVITLEIRKGGKNHKLLLSADPSYSRLHGTSLSYKNPIKAPDFCMLLRKYLQFSIITGIEQVGIDRILKIHLEGRDKKNLSLMVEIMGRHSNIILLKEGIILGCMKRITSRVSRFRQVLPGLPYLDPPVQDKRDPLTMDPEEIKVFFGHDKKKAYQVLLENIQGLGPLTARELLLRSQIDPDFFTSTIGEDRLRVLQQVFWSFQKELQKGDFSPSVILDEENRVISLSAITLTCKEGHRIRKFSSMKDLFDFYYQEKIIKEKLSGLKKSLLGKVEEFHEKRKGRLQQLEADFEKGQKAHEYRKKGDLLTTYLYQLKRGLTEITLPLLEDPQTELTILLNPALGPAENAQKYYQRYQKLKKSCHHLHKEMEKLENELKYLKAVQASIILASDEEDLLAIKEELEEESYIKVKKRGPNQKKTRKPLFFQSSQGYTIFVGRNNKENDYLTMKLANREDIWLHVKELAGSHVIIKRPNREEVPEKTIEEAAILAACHSQGHISSKVLVDYTLVKHVQKPKEARPGMVYYKEFKTIQVTPDTRVMEQLKKEV